MYESKKKKKIEKQMHIFSLGLGAHGVMVIVIGNGLSEPSSNQRLGSLHFT